MSLNNVMEDDYEYDMSGDGAPGDEGDRQGAPAWKRHWKVATGALIALLSITLAAYLLGGDTPTPQAPVEASASAYPSPSTSASEGAPEYKERERVEGEGGKRGIGLSRNKEGDLASLNRTARDFALAVYGGDGRVVYDLTSGRCRQSVADAQEFADAYKEAVGSDYDLSNLTYDTEPPRLGIAFVHYVAGGKPDANLDVYFLWDRASGYWVMDSCN